MVMELFNIFKKKKDPYPDELQDCLDRIELLKSSLIKMKDCSDSDTEALNHMAQLGEEFWRWDAMAKQYLRYHVATYTSSYGQVKVK